MKNAELTPKRNVAPLTVDERLLLFCVASGIDYSRAGISGAVARTMVVKDFVAHDRKTTRLVLTARGRKMLQALLAGAGIKLASLN